MNKIGNKYSDFFKQNCRERYLIMCGGRRSAKTFSTFAYLYAIALLTKIKVIVLTFSFDTLKATIEDFSDSLNLEVIGRKTGYECELSNGSVFQFNHCNMPTKALGTKCDYLFINESCNLPEEVFDAYNLGARQQVICNYNPTSVAWSDKLINEDGVNFLRTTWQDNNYLTDAQIKSFDELRIRFENPNHSILDEYNYYVFYLGEQCKASGMIFPKLQIISDYEYESVPTEEYLGLDFGFAVDGDPTALVGVKIYDDIVWVKEYMCEQGLVYNEELYQKIINNVDPDAYISVDTGGQGASRAREMVVEQGANFVPAIKKPILDNINDIISFSMIKVCGDKIYKEMSSMEFDAAKGKIKAPYGDHCTDAMRYAFNVARYSYIK